MTDHIAGLGHNNPPDQIDTINAAHEAAREEAENWLDGTPVETEAQMTAVDALRKAAREWRMALEAGQKSSTAPLYDAYKAELARWKPSVEDAQRIEKGLVALVDGFKRKLAAEREAAARKAREEAYAVERAAKAAAATASAADIEAQREAARMHAAADEAHKAAREADSAKVKGMRTVTRHEVTDHRALLHWIAANDRDALVAFLDDYAKRNASLTTKRDGLNVWQEKVAV